MKFICFFPGLLFAVYTFAQPGLSAGQWMEDLTELAGLLEREHPDPYAHISKPEFDSLKKEVEKMIRLNAGKKPGEISIVTGMMKLVSSLRDGHTALFPNDPNGFNHWFPVGFYRFNDGIYVTSAHNDYAGLIGKKVLRFGETPAGRAFELTADLLSSDNAFGRFWNTFYLSSGEALQAVNILGDPAELKLTVAVPDGKPEETTVRAVETNFSLEHRFWGEMYGPGKTPDDQYRMSGNRDIARYRQGPEANPDLPLHLRSRRAYWHAYLPEYKTMYLHMTHVTEAGRGNFPSFEAFYNQVFEEVENKDVEKFILDIRYNSGGDGSVLIPFVHKFICAGKINQPGKLFTITGRKVYSAGIMLYDLMLKHTHTLLAGEPAGGGRNHYGDAGSFYLKNSGLQLDISSTYWQLTSSKDTASYDPVDIPGELSGSNYFTGNDPVLDYILSLEGPYRSIPEILRHQDGQAAKAEFSKRKADFGKYPWWNAFEENEMRYAAREHFGAGRPGDGAIGFEILLEVYPGSWRAWRDLGDGHLKTGDASRALECYKKGLELNPGYEEFREKIRVLGG